MSLLRWIIALLFGGALAGGAAAHAAPLEPPIWSTLPFILTLLAIAILPLAAAQFWHSNWHKAIVMALLAVPVAVYLVMTGPATDGESVRELVHSVQEYVPFITLLTALYAVAGGIAIEGDIAATPFKNSLLLALGAVLANFIGTTGASMLLIRLVLRINRGRRRLAHVPVFFIFIVSNLGGLLTPLGDPPLFLGYLNGIDFFWTLRLWPHWLVCVGSVLVIFFVWDSFAFRGEPARYVEGGASKPIQIRGVFNLFCLLGIVLAVLFGQAMPSGMAEGVMLLMLLLSFAITPRDVRAVNEFSWGPIVEVAILFAGIFVTMVPALALLRLRGPELHLSQAWEYYWLSGSLSSFLDNAPTYLTFATLAAAPDGIATLATANPRLLEAVSCGSVMMGANTYIGNGPNFMVKAIADAAGVPTPSFFVYMLYSVFILLPVFGLVTWLFFLPR